jgi:hypothetical protein
LFTSYRRVAEEHLLQLLLCILLTAAGLLWFNHNLFFSCYFCKKAIKHLFKSW